MEELNTLLHSEPFKAVDLPLGTQEFRKLTSVSNNFSDKEIKVFSLSDELQFCESSKGSTSLFAGGGCWSLGLSLSLYFNYFARREKKERNSNQPF